MDNTVTNTEKSLYERLGVEPKVRKIANDVLDKNLSNPLISYHFRDIEISVMDIGSGVARFGQKLLN